ncbi:GTP-binding protein [Candidatus Woesearchaeota archaeon]|nr:GTP-binding protein [Candidatus Woesearchaeota archaeon]
MDVVGKKSIMDQIKELEREISQTKYNKATQHHIGLVKAKIARLKEKQLSRSKGGPKGEGYSVKKSGDATVILIGFPSVGKSTLLNSLTAAKSTVAAYEFTTLTVIPGTMEWKGARIQLLDVPGIVQGAAVGRGRGREVLGVAMSADMVLLMVDALHPEHADILVKEVEDYNLRLNQRKPDVKIIKTSKGGLDIGTTVKMTKLPIETAKSILREMSIVNAQVVIREDITADQLIDIIENNKKYIPAVTVLNKMDLLPQDALEAVRRGISADICISADQRVNLTELKDLIYNRLQFIRVYTKEAGKKADMNEPIIMLEGTTIKDICNKLHKDFVTKFKFARIWGSSKFPGQIFKNMGYELKDGDVIEIHVR